jgi:hypothetical protein
VTDDDIERVRRAFARFATEPYGDLALNADRAAGIAVAALRRDPNPDCPDEFHGADGGACATCGWDSHPIADHAACQHRHGSLGECPAIPTYAVPVDECEHGRWNPDNQQCLDCGQDLNTSAPEPHDRSDDWDPGEPPEFFGEFEQHRRATGSSASDGAP